MPAKTTEQFVAEAKRVHENKYDYSKVEYKNCKHKVNIVCLQEGHGLFQQQPSNHLQGQGCPKFRIIKLTVNSARRSSIEQFISKARKVHGDSYDYSKAEYKNSNTNIAIICHIEGHGIFTPLEI